MSYFWWGDRAADQRDGPVFDRLRLVQGTFCACLARQISPVRGELEVGRLEIRLVRLHDPLQVTFVQNNEVVETLAA